MQIRVRITLAWHAGRNMVVRRGCWLDEDLVFRNHTVDIAACSYIGTFLRLFRATRGKWRLINDVMTLVTAVEEAAISCKFRCSRTSDGRKLDNKIKYNFVYPKSQEMV
jgi:hypothetical protein